MNDRETRLRDLLRMEVSLKGTQSSWAFMAFSAFVFFYCFNCITFNLTIKLSMAMVFLVGAWRVRTASKVKKKNIVDDETWKKMVISIWLNALGWSIAFNLASFELKLAGIHFIIVTTMIAGFIAASLFTLGYDPILFLPFQLLMLVPQMGIVFYYYKSPEKIDALPLIPIYFMYFIYQMRQLRDFRSQLLSRMNYQIDLEFSNQELQKSQNALIEQTTKLMHSSRLAALGEMSAGIAHEVNNPLTIILGSVQQIERITQRQDFEREKIIQLTQKALQGIERMIKIIRGLRHFSQQSDTLPKAKTPLHEIIDETSSFCSELLSARYIKFNVDQIPLVHVECNPVQISQVLINLIKNAEDALEAVGEDEERWIQLAFLSNNESISICVVNGGPKITREVEEKLFQPFFTTKPIGKGTGIGLSISRGIMREHSGNLTYDPSRTNTTFVMTLPSLIALD